MKILGLDVSSISTGYCIFSNGRLTKSTCGLIQPNPKKSYGERLYTFEVELKKILKKYKPDEVIIEDIFKGRNIFLHLIFGKSDLRIEGQADKKHPRERDHHYGLPAFMFHGFLSPMHANL